MMSTPMVMVSPTMMLMSGRVMAVMAVMTVSMPSVMSALAPPMSRVLAVPGPFVPATAMTPFATFMTRHSLSVIATPAVLGMLASPVVPALRKFVPAIVPALGKIASVVVAVPSAARPRPVIGLLAMSTTVTAAFTSVPPIAFVACIATVVRPRIATVVCQFVRSGLVALRQAPVKMGCKLQQRGCRNSSQKHQHVISHPTTPSPDLTTLFQSRLRVTLAGQP
jgi:hypothetical protein